MPSFRRLRFAPLVLALLASHAWAATSVTSAGQATAAVANACVIVSADNLSFGGYSPVSGLDAFTNGQIHLRCTKGAAFAVVPTSGGSALRGTGGSLAYALYADSGLSKQWGTPHSSGTVAFDSSRHYNGGNGTGVLALFHTQMSAAQFAANPSLASQPYGIAKTGPNAYVYYVNYIGQPLDPNSLAAMATANPGSTYVNVANNVRVGDPGALPTTTDVGALVLPANTAKTGTVYQVSTGFVDSTNLTGTATSGLSDQVVNYYGKIPAGQDMTPGFYTDTVVFTVSF
jgi:spore coat protein U-like protein